MAGPKGGRRQDGVGTRHLTRLALPPRGSSAGTTAGNLDAADLPRVVGSVGARAPRDIARAPDGSFWVLTDDAVEVLDRFGTRLRRIPHTLDAPLALDFDAAGRALVLDAATPARLARLLVLHPDGTSEVAARIDLMELGQVRGFAVAPSGEVVLADPAVARVVRLAPDLSTVLGDVKPPDGVFVQPTTVAFVGGRLVVGDLLFTRAMDEAGTQVLATWRAVPHGTYDPPRILRGQRDLVVMSNPDQGGITVHDLNGRLLQEACPPLYSPLRRGQGLAATPEGLVFVAEYEDDTVRIYDWAKP